MTSPSEYIQLTNFSDSATRAQLVARRANGHLQTRRRLVPGTGQIFVKLLPNGESVPADDVPGQKVRTGIYTGRHAESRYTDAESGQWDTWTVPVLGGQPARLLPNASGLTWIADQRGAVLRNQDRQFPHGDRDRHGEPGSLARDLHAPGRARDGALLLPSPDRRSVLVVEMTDSTRLPTVPIGAVRWKLRGPSGGTSGHLHSAAWSPDGRWMYFAARVVGGTSHLWRQRFPDGAPEQITFGPLEEEGLAVAPDGRSLVTSIGMRRSALWIHDAAGERAILSEGYASAPRLSRDGTRVFYLSARGPGARRHWAGWHRHPTCARSTSRPERATAAVGTVRHRVRDFARREGSGVHDNDRRWSNRRFGWRSLDRHTPPRLVVGNGDQVSFGAPESSIFRSLEGKTNLLIRIKKDGTGRERISAVPILDKYGVSPDGEWIIIQRTWEWIFSSAHPRWRPEENLWDVPGNEKNGLPTEDSVRGDRVRGLPPTDARHSRCRPTNRYRTCQRLESPPHSAW